MIARTLPNIGIPDSVIMPPHSVEAEQAVLGGLLLDNRAWDRIGDVVSEGDLYRQDHRQILRAIVRQIADNHPADAVTVAEALQSLGELENVGGLAYIVALASNTPSAANIHRYAEIVREHAARRAMIEAGHRIAALGTERGLENEERIAKATAEVLRLTETGQRGREAVTMREAVHQAIERLDERVNNPGGLSGLATGFTALDELLGGLHPGDLIVVAGRPSMGKTTFSQNVAENVSAAGRAVFFASLEMPAEAIAERALARYGRVDTKALRAGKLDQLAHDGLTVAVGKLRDSRLIIQDDPSKISSAARLRIEAIRARHKLGGIDLILIDYLQLMSSDGQTRNDELGKLTRGLKLLAKELSVPVILLSQLSRKCVERPDKRPQMSDLRESGAIEQDADVILGLYRDEVYNPDSPFLGLAEVLVRKNRMGPLGTVFLRFEGEYSRFSDADQSEVARASAAASSKPKSKKFSRGFDD